MLQIFYPLLKIQNENVMTFGETDGSRRAKTVRLTVHEFTSLSVGRLVSQSPSVSVAQPTCQSVSQSLVSSSTRQSINQSVSQSVSQLVKVTVSQSVRLPEAFVPVAWGNDERRMYSGFVVARARRETQEEREKYFSLPLAMRF